MTRHFKEGNNNQDKRRKKIQGRAGLSMACATLCCPLSLSLKGHCFVQSNTHIKYSPVHCSQRSNKVAPCVKPVTFSLCYVTVSNSLANYPRYVNRRNFAAVSHCIYVCLANTDALCLVYHIFHHFIFFVCFHPTSTI